MAAYPLATRLAAASPVPYSAGPAPADEFTSDLVAARVTIAQLARWARRHLLAQHGSLGAGETCCCPQGRCRLAEVPGGQDACRLARELAWLPLAEAGSPRPDAKPEEIALQYLGALRAAERAVFYCQRIQHVLGDCWFSASAVAGDGLCARTLSAAQLLTVARRVL